MTAEFQPDLSVLKGRTVLLASENQTNQGLLAHYLTDWQVNIIKIEGLQLNSQSGIQPDVIIIDLRLVHDAAQRRLQTWQRSYPETPIIALLPLGKRLGEAKRYQTLTTVPKPIRPAALYQALATIIDGQTRIDQKLRPSPQFDTDLGRRHPLRILMAEDNLVNQKVAQGILKKLGYRADIAANGLEVLEALDRQPYDVILMDVNMPEMDGVTATKKIRHERAAGEQPHIISMTANAMEGDREQYLAAGMNDYISKPIRLEELIKALLKVTPLSKQHATDEPGNH
jgi:CheY-like chemotaxis protein